MEWWEKTSWLPRNWMMATWEHSTTCEKGRHFKDCCSSKGPMDQDELHRCTYVKQWPNKKPWTYLHTDMHTALVRKKQAIGQNDPRLCEPEKRRQLSHRCRVGAEALLPPYLSRLPEHHHPTPLCLKFDHLEVHTANMSPLLKGQHSWDSWWDICQFCLHPCDLMRQHSSWRCADIRGW